MNDLQKNKKEGECDSWKRVVDKVVDLIASKSTLHVLSDKIEKQAISEGRKPDSTKQTIKEIIRRKLLKELLKADRSEGNKLTEIHVNESFKEEDDASVKCSSLYESTPQQDKIKESRMRHASMNFLDEQYNLTKEAIARRYRPQIKLNVASMKNNAMRDYLKGPFTDDLHRISNVASETIQLTGRRRHKKVPRRVPRPSEASKSKPAQ